MVIVILQLKYLMIKSGNFQTNVKNITLFILLYNYLSVHNRRFKRKVLFHTHTRCCSSEITGIKFCN